MENAFQLFGLSLSPHVEVDAVETLFHQGHRSTTDGSVDQETWNRAYQTLRAPSKRLRHLLELQDISIPRNTSISEELLSLFTKVQPALAKGQSFRKEMEAAHSDLARSLLAGEQYRAQLDLQETLQSLQAAYQERLDELIDIQAEDEAALLRLQADFTFLEKWTAQTQEELLKFLLLD
ncbi:MAG: hypothetical protein AAF191_11580 [Verrucomicrobiota bacterium]